MLSMDLHISQSYPFKSQPCVSRLSGRRRSLMQPTVDFLANRPLFFPPFRNAKQCPGPRSHSPVNPTNTSCINKPPPPLLFLNAPSLSFPVNYSLIHRKSARQQAFHKRPLRSPIAAAPLLLLLLDQHGEDLDGRLAAQVFGPFRSCLAGVSCSLFLFVVFFFLGFVNFNFFFFFFFFFFSSF